MQGQRRSHSFLEQIANQFIGFTISWPINIVLLPMLGMPSSVGKAFWVTAMFMAISVVRGYFTRRLFNYIHVKQTTF